MHRGGGGVWHGPTVRFIGSKPSEEKTSTWTVQTSVRTTVLMLDAVVPSATLMSSTLIRAAGTADLIVARHIGPAIQLVGQRVLGYLAIIGFDPIVDLHRIAVGFEVQRAAEVFPLTCRQTARLRNGRVAGLAKVYMAIGPVLLKSCQI